MKKLFTLIGLGFIALSTLAMASKPQSFWSAHDPLTCQIRPEFPPRGKYANAYQHPRYCLGSTWFGQAVGFDRPSGSFYLLNKPEDLPFQPGMRACQSPAFRAPSIPPGNFGSGLAIHALDWPWDAIELYIGRQAGKC